LSKAQRQRCLTRQRQFDALIRSETVKWAKIVKSPAASLD